MKQKNLIGWACLLTWVLAAPACRQTPQEISLAGEWQFALDPKDVGLKEEWQGQPLPETLYLPGSLQEQGKGEDIGLDTKWTGQIVDSSWYKAPEYAAYRKPGNIKVPFWLNPDKHYTGAAWYQRKVNIPAEWENRPIELELERTHWSTTLFVDGKETGSRNSLQTPHRYILEGLQAGEHTLTLRVDNRLYVDVGYNAHSVSDHTQSNWNGIVGDIRLTAKPSLYLGDIRIDPDIRNKQAHVKIELKGEAPDTDQPELSLQAKTLDGKPMGKSVRLSLGKEQTVEATVDLGADAGLWSEHTPNVYRMEVTLHAAAGEDHAAPNFGLREFKANGTRFEVNGRPVFLRGTLECCIFPLTGYPSMEKDYWATNLRYIIIH